MSDSLAAVLWVAILVASAWFIGWSFGLWEWLGYLLS